MIDRLIESGRCCGTEKNVDKTKEMRNSRKTFKLLIMKDQKHLENVEYFYCLSRMITNDARSTRKIKSTIAIAKAVLDRKKNLFTSKLEMNLRK
jgi:hypothetical protein